MGESKGDEAIITVGMSMGAPLASFGAYTMKLALSKNVQGAVTFGMPRIGNSNFVIGLMDALDVGVKTVGFAWGRDPVPHAPPRFFGYRSSQGKLFHVINEVKVTERHTWHTRGQDADIGDFISYDKVYLNYANSFAGDKEFASATSTLHLPDHAKYFNGVGRHGCGFDSADGFLQVGNVAE